eukprot:1703604-Amphidinium_carterae.1
MILAEEVQEIIDSFLSRFEHVSGEQLKIRLLVNADKTVFVSGGMQRRDAVLSPYGGQLGRRWTPHAGVAGTDPLPDGGRHEHPFRLHGEDESGNADSHTYQNMHDIATMTVRHFMLHHRANWHCQPMLDDPTGGEASTVASSGSSSTGYDSSDDLDSSADSSTPRSARISRLRRLVRWMAVAAYAPDASQDVSTTSHAYSDQRQLPFLDEEDEDETDARILKHTAAFLAKWRNNEDIGRDATYSPAPLHSDDKVDDHVGYMEYEDYEADYTDYEDEKMEAARDRRIAILKDRLVAVAAGQHEEDEDAEFGVGVDDLHDVTLTNPNELARLCRLHCIDLSRIPVDYYPRRDVTWDLATEERYVAEDDLELCRFMLIAYYPRMLQWKRVCRSPLTEDDLIPDRAQCVIEGYQTWLAWNNPQQAQRIERRYVEDWQRERLRRLLQEAQGVPRDDLVRVDLVMDQSADREAAVADLRAYLRMNAAPVEPYEVRLWADLIGDDLYVTGGAGTPRNNRTPSTSMPEVNLVETFVHAPVGPDMETALACIQWIVKVETKQKPPYDYLRVVAYTWVRRALRYQYPVAGLQLSYIAQQFGLGGDEFIEKYWNPDTPMCRTPPVLLVFALSCVYFLDMAVVDEHGARPDGLCRGPKWRIKLVDKRWQIWCRTSELDFLQFGTLSSTLPFEISSSQVPHDESDGDCEVQGGAGLVRRLGSLAKVMRARLKASAKERRELMILVARGKDLLIRYVGKISSKVLLELFAKAKRVGREYLTLRVCVQGEWRIFRHGFARHVNWNWTGLTVVVENNRMSKAGLEKLVEEELYECAHSHLNLIQMRQF